MAKKVKTVLRIQLPAGNASPAPPVGPVLGPYGINIMAFCKEYNERTSSQAGSIIPAEITIYEDRSFSFVTKTPPATDLLKKALNLEKGSDTAGLNSIGKLSKDKVREIAQVKLNDLNAINLEGAMKIIEGTARSMGIEVIEDTPQEE